MSIFAIDGKTRRAMALALAFAATGAYAADMAGLKSGKGGVEIADEPQLAFKGVKLDEIRDFTFITQLYGRSIESPYEDVRGRHPKACDMDGDGRIDQLAIQFAIYADGHTKGIVLVFTNGDGGVYVRRNAKFWKTNGDYVRDAHFDMDPKSGAITFRAGVGHSTDFTRGNDYHASGIRLKDPSARTTDGSLQPVVVKATLPDGTLTLSATFSRGNGVKEESGVIPAKAKAARLSERVGRKFQSFESEDAPGIVTRRTIVSGVTGNYRRMVYSIRNTGDKPVKIEDISFLRDWAPSAALDGYRSGNTDGSVAVFPSKRVFVGVEHPMAKLTVEDGAVTAHLPRGFDLLPGEEWNFSYVVGRYEGESPRRDFQAYLEAERAHPYRVMTHYNSWFDLNIDRNNMAWEKRMDEAEALGVMKAFRSEMGRRGVFIQSYLWDDGWDDWNSLWAFHPGFPNGFKAIAGEAHKDKGASIGAWMSPCGGYGRSLAARVAYSRSKGLIGKNDNQLKMSNPTYYAAFRDRVMDMIKSYDMNLFKFDRMGAGKPDDNGCDATYAPEIDAVVRLIGEMRRAKEDVFVNCTVGTWASPYWVMFADSIWRGGADFARAGTGTDRQRWLTYRDNRIYDRFVRPCPLFPLNSMMMHGIIVTENGAPKCMDCSASAQSTQDFADEVWMGVGCGTGLQEYYITPRLMSPKWWDILADGVKWLKANERTLRDVHWIGGDPVGRGGAGAIYGYASATKGKGVVTIRNSSDKPLKFSEKLSTLLDLPASESGAAVKSQKTVYSHDAEIGKVARVTDALSVSLAPHAMAVVEFELGN